MATFKSSGTDKDVKVQPTGTGAVKVGTGSAAAVVSSEGDQDLTLQTGNATTGTITITDGADGDISISPNGTGTVVVNTDLDVDNININGNTISSTDTNGDITLDPNGTGNVIAGSLVRGGSSPSDQTSLGAAGTGIFLKSTDAASGAEELLIELGSGGYPDSGNPTISLKGFESGGSYETKIKSNKGKDLVFTTGSGTASEISYDGDIIAGRYLKSNIIFAKTADGDLSISGNSSGGPVASITVDSSGDVTFSQSVDIDSGTIDGTTIGGTTPAAGSFTTINGATIDGYATTSEVQGTHTTGSIISGTTALTVASGTGISTGDYVTGQGITPGTTVSAISGTSVTLSANANATLSSDPVSFYKSTKLLSPGLVAGQLCRAWVNFNGTGTVAIRASGNVSSITDNGTGDYTVNFTTAMPDTNYCVNTQWGDNVSTAWGISSVPYSHATSSISVIATATSSSAKYDVSYMLVSIFR